MQEEKYADLVWDRDEAAHKIFIENLAPIVLFTYNRLDHTRQTIEALQRNVYAKESLLYIFSDAPKNAQAAEAVQDVRAYLHSVDGFKEIRIVERDENWGLARNIIDGVTKIVNQYGKIIVLEDDIVTSKWFLKYMNDALIIYANEDRVMAISGYCWPKDKEGLPETFFLPWFSCWGWATWKRSWDYFERNPEDLVKNHSMEHNAYFNMNGFQNMWSQVTQNVQGSIYTWAIFFYTAIFLQKGLILYHKEDLCKNIGFDASGEHCGTDMNGDFSREIIGCKPVLHFTRDIQISNVAVLKIGEFYQAMEKRNTFSKRFFRVWQQEGIKGLFKRLIKRL